MSSDKHIQVYNPKYRGVRTHKVADLGCGLTVGLSWGALAEFIKSRCNEFCPIRANEDIIGFDVDEDFGINVRIVKK